MADLPDRAVAVAPRRRFLLPLVALIISAGLLAALFVGVATPPESGGTPLTGREAPAFRLGTTDGQTLALSDLRGQLVLVNFWASWCIPCREEAPMLAKAARDYGGRGLRVVGVLYQDDAEGARKFEAEYGLTYQTVLDPDGRTAIDFGVLGIPESFLIDQDGIVRDRQIGPYTAEELRRKIELFLP